MREAFVSDEFTAQRLDEAAALLFEELFALGLFENPCVDPEEADHVVANADAQAAAADAHRRSVVLAENHAAPLPLTARSLSGRTVSVELMEKDLTVKALDALRERLEQARPGVGFTTDLRRAGVVLVLMKPFLCAYLDVVGITDLSIGEHAHIDTAKLARIRESVDTMVIGPNAMHPWLLDTVEPLADALLVGSESDDAAMADAALGGFAPSGRLPITFPIDAASVAVDAHGRCASPDDVPGDGSSRSAAA